MHNYFPFINDVKSYKAAYLKPDIVAALSVAIVASPQSMAYAVIAGVSPIYGLYASIIPVIMAALFGSSRYLLAGPTNAISIILFSSIAQLSIAGVVIANLPEEQKLPYIFAIALLCGLMQLVMGLSRLGNLANFISHSVITAFATAGAVIVAVGQIKSLLGLEYQQRANFPDMLLDLANNMQNTNIYSLALGLGAIIFVLIIRKINRKIPSAIFALVIFSCIAYFFDLSSYGVKLVGDIPKSIVQLSLPNKIGFAELSALFLPALAIALLASVESIAIARNLATENKEKFDANQELIGQGLGNIAAGLFSGIPGCGSFGRTAVNYQSGAKTRFAAVFSGIFTLVALYFFGFLISYIPLTLIAALLIVIVLRIVNLHELRFIFYSTKVDRYVLIATLGTAFIAGLEMAVIFGVIISLLLFVNKLSHPIVKQITRSMLKRQEFDWAITCPSIAMYSLQGTLFFGAVQELEEKLYSYENFNHQIVLLEISRVNWLDASSVHALYGFIERLETQNISVIIASANDNVKTIFKRTKLTSKFQKTYLVATLDAAIHLAQHLLLEKSCPCCNKQCSSGQKVLKESCLIEKAQDYECLPN